MQFVFAAFVLISFVEGKSVTIYEDPIVEVKHVDNQQHTLSLPSGEVSVQQNSNAHISSHENDIKPVIEQNLKEPQVVIDTTISEKRAELLRNFLNGKISVKQTEIPSVHSSESANPTESKLKTANVVVVETNSQNVLPSLLDEGISKGSRKFHDDEEESNDLKGNDLFYTSKGTTYPLTRAFNGRTHLNILNRKNVHPYIVSSDSGKSTEQKLKTNNVVTSETDSRSNQHLLPALDGGIYSRNVHGNGDDTDIKENDLFYTSKGRTLPLTRDSYGRSYLNLNKKPTDHEIIMDNVDLETNSNSNQEILMDYINSNSKQHLLPALDVRRFHGNEDDYDTKGNDLYYTSKGRTFPLTRSFNGRSYLDMNRKNGNLHISSTDFVKPTDQKIKTDYDVTSKTNSHINPNLIPSLVSEAGILLRRFQGNEDDSDIKGNELYYTSDGITYPLTRSFGENKYFDIMDRRNANSNFSPRDFVKPTDQKIQTDNAVTSKPNSHINPHLLPSLLDGGGALLRRFHGNENDYDIKGNDLYYTGNGRTYPLTRSFGGRNYLDYMNRRNAHSYFPSKDSGFWY